MPRWALAFVLLAGAALLYAGYHIGRPAQRPNVVFLLLDTLRADRLGASRNGVPIMPFLDEFAKGGANFTHAISPASWTKPTLASLFTGLYPETHHVRFSANPDGEEKTSDVLAPAFETLAEALGDAGYDNWGIQTNENGRAEYGMAQGFAKGHYEYTEFQPGRIVTDKAVALLEHMKPPFFLFAQYVDPHTPYTPEADYKTIFGPQPQITPDDAKLIDGGDEAFREFFQDDTEVWLGRRPQRTLPALSEAGKEALRYRYDAECRQLDDQVARLVRTIEGQHPETIFVLVSDHGDEHFERGTIGHSHTVYEELIHVPLIVRGPGIPAGEVPQTISTMGIWPTLAKTLGLPSRPQWQARDLFAQAQAPAPVFSWTQGSYDDGKVNCSAMIDGALKMINSPIAPNITPPAHDETQLYDLPSDPGEKTNLYPRALADDIPVLAKLERHREANAKAGEAIEGGSLKLSTQAKEQLEALGYLNNDEKDSKDQKDAAPSIAPSSSSIESTMSISSNSTLNILLIIIDTLRADRVAAVRNGVPVMPHLHALAKESVWYTQAIAQASWTKPSVTSILTGLYTQTHGVQFGIQKPWIEGQQMTVQGLAPEKPTVLAFFKQHGYATAAIQTNVHLQNLYGFGLGCDDYHYAKWANATDVTDQTLARVQTLKAPFAIYTHYFDPHADFAPPSPHREAFGPLPALTPEEEKLLHDDYHQNYYLQKAKLDMGLSRDQPAGTFSETAREHIRQLYDGECHYTDEQLHRLITAVRKDHPNTIIVVTSDHGEEFWEHNGLGHAKTVYQELINVPLIISIPNAPAREVTTPVEVIDIAPTLAAALKLTPLAHWQGRDILATPLTERPVYAETRGSFPEANLQKEAILSGTKKLIRDVTKNINALYDLAADPRETQDLAPATPRDANTLAKELYLHNQAAMNAPLAQIPPPILNLEGHPTQTENRDTLEALGYLGVTNTPELTTAP